MSQTLTALSAAFPLAAGWSLHGWRLRRRIEAARRDPLTGLPTRATFERHAARALARGPHAVLMLDLDRFKQLNDRFGHAVGDAAIRTSATSLTEALNGRGMAARLGGDEFAAVVPLPTPAALTWLLRGLHNEITTPFRLDGRVLRVGASIGAVWSPELPGADLSTLLRRADEAMYAAKRAGGGWRLADDTTGRQGSVNGRRAGRAGTHGGDLSCAP